MGKQQGSLGSNGGGGKLQALAMMGITLDILTNQTSPVRRLWKGSFFPNLNFQVVWGLRCKLLSVIKVCPSWGDWNLMQMLLRSFCRELPHSFGFYKNGIHQKLQVPQIEVLTYISCTSGFCKRNPCSTSIFGTRNFWWMTPLNIYTQARSMLGVLTHIYPLNYPSVGE